MVAQWTVTTRHGGVSPPPYDSLNLGIHVGDAPEFVLENRRRLATSLDVTPDRIVWMDQVHGTHVEIVDKPVVDALPKTDAIVTRSQSVVLAVLTADCVPILLADNDAAVVGAAHAGRVGARDGIALRVVDKMVELGAKRSNIEAFIGPAACGSCYEVPDDMAADVDAHLPGSASKTLRGTASLDLPLGIENQLRAVGVRTVVRDQRCTIEAGEMFSHRRGAPTGRFASLIWISADEHHHDRRASTRQTSDAVR
ncbi:peptidoglycan editing factor PgeF [Hoyosella rhizosphaerae]|uniref:Purine nucleoside phosphorylase n=1 Tax=Hoyosella rhizosphaerae TaxID=1755582 RepID=A0A916UES4_9ACTN|nr:peptidoglycan editing factor PgeF [Hoyosella rhizosphaerae]MBN4927909.1 peptidoglycan editing factor PgeF [Hoyosella rhizosphaerae]GGC70925.1 laccase domain protein [Hoyosella rhizosphaerae]